MKRHLNLIVLAIGGLLICFFSDAFYVVDESQQIIITQFGIPVNDVVRNAGLYLKMPLVQKVNVFDKRLLDWDGAAIEICSKDKILIIVDMNAIWKISDPLLFMKSFEDRISALARLDDIIGQATNDLMSKHNLEEIVRSPDIFQNLQIKVDEQEISHLHEINNLNLDSKTYHSKVTRSILRRCRKDVPEKYGIEIVDVKVKHIYFTQ